MAIGLISAGIGAISGLAQGLIGGGARRREERQAMAEFARMKERFMGLDTSNPYANMENVYEDLTVNTQAAEFAAQQQQQGMANILGGLQGAAGGSGIAALAQSLAQQQAQSSQAAAASIGQQEAQQQALAAQGAMSLQAQERQGELISRQMEQQKTEALLQMSAGRLQRAQEARQQATQALVGGISGIAGLAGGAALAGGGEGIGAGFQKLAGMGN